MITLNTEVPPSSGEQQQPASPKASNSGKKTPEWRIIAYALSSQSWSDGKSYSVFTEGRFDLSKDSFIRITFAPSQAGTKFFLRLLPKGANPSQPVGVRWEKITIPGDGMVKLNLKASEFGLTPKDMSQLVQISIHSGTNAWNRSLEQDADKQAHFQQIEAQ